MRKILIPLAAFLLFTSTWSSASWKISRSEETSIDGTEILYTESGDASENNWLTLATLKTWMGTNIAIVIGSLADLKIDVGATDENLLSATPVDKTLQGYTAEQTDTLLFSKAPLVASSVDGGASGSLSAAQVSGTIIRNYGQGAGDVALVLPTAAAGYNFLATVGTAQSNKWGVQAGSNDKIYLLAADGTIVAGSDNGYARMTAAQVGQSFACWTFQTGASAWDWMCKAGSIGTSIFAAN